MNRWLSFQLVFGAACALYGAVSGNQVRFTYTPTGQRASMVDASGTHTSAYDSRDRLVTNRWTVIGTDQTITLSYAYDGFGNIAALESSSPNGTKVNYYYDSLNRLTNVTDRFTQGATYAFDAVGNLDTARYANLVTNRWQYSSLNRLTNVSVTTASGTIAGFAYRLAPAGNRTNLIEAISGTSRTNAWSYDALYRLTNEIISGSAPAGTISYRYDAVGNRTNRASTVSGITNQTFSYNANDWLTSDSYDSNGNTTNSAGNNYRYDVENRLTNLNSGVVTFIYDGDGNRRIKTVGGTNIYFVVDTRSLNGYSQVVEEFTTVGSTPDRLYTHGLDLICQRQGGGTTSYYGYDGNGNVRFLTASNASVSDTYAYDAFGNLIASTGTTPNNYRYTGEQYDPHLGFYYLRARHLNAGTGRFWTRDTSEGFQTDALSQHRYLYAHDDPVNRLDPSGHTDFIQTIMATRIGMTIMAMGGPAIVATHRYASTTIRGTARAMEVAQRVVASGGDIVAWEERIMRATQAGVQVIGRFKLDMVVKLPGRQVNTLIESKSVPWDLYTRHRQGWENFLTSMSEQAKAFAQATQSQSGVPIGERVIYFTSRAPKGLEKAGDEVLDVVRNHYQAWLWGEQMLDDFLLGRL